MSLSEQPPQPGDHRPEPPSPPPGPRKPPPYGSPMPPAPYEMPGIYGPSFTARPEDYPTYVPMDKRPGFRPGCVTVGVIVAALGALMLLCTGFAFLYLPSADEAYRGTYECYEVDGEKICGQTNDVMVQVVEEVYGISLATLALITIGLTAFVAVMAVGVWQMKRWGWWLFILNGGFWSLIWLLSLLNGALLGLVLLLVMAGTLIWFGRNKWRFI